MVELVEFKDENPTKSRYRPAMTPSALTTTEAAALASVAPSTIKRWADQGILPFSRTAGGHRRFQRGAVETLVRAQAGSTGADGTLMATWIGCLVSARRHEVDGRLLEARSRLGSWAEVADELGAVLTEMGSQWACGRLTIAEEHVASDCLARALGRLGESLPVALTGPTCLLACAGEDEHTLGLSLAELCAREMGWAPLWLGRRTPVSEIVRVLRGGQVQLVILGASPLMTDARALHALVAEVGAVCKEAGAGLVLGGSGAWPAQPDHGLRLTSFAGFRDHLATHPRGR